VDITSEQVAALTERFLLSQYNEAVPIPKFHQDIWEQCCSKDKLVVIAAPRGHAKSTAITHAFILTAVLLGKKKYVFIVSDTESQASMFLGSLKNELETNEQIRSIFQVRDVRRDTLTDMIVRREDNSEFRISAYGSEQKVRGRKWEHLRPDLIVIDDLENDEMVESEARREKLRDWFFKALLPSLSRTGHIRVIGTILHMDSLLQRLIENKSWTSLFYKAHKGFDDFSERLWDEMWPEERLRSERQVYIDQGFPEGYSQEYLNNPIDQAQAYFRKDDLLEMDDDQRALPKNYYAGIDFAISDSDRAAYTAIVVGGMDAFGRLHIVDVRRFRGATDMIIDEMIAAQRAWNVDGWVAESGAIVKALEGELYRRMVDENVVMNLELRVPTKDKRSRARSIQGRTRAHGVFFDKTAGWFPALEAELTHFPKGTYNDQVDALAWLGLLIHGLTPGPSEEELEEESKAQLYEDMLDYSGASEHTGY